MPLSYLRQLWSELSEQGRRTLPWDLIRGGCEGAGSTFVGTFSLLIAIEYFHCSPSEKSLIAAGSHWGLGLSVFYATYAHALIGKRNIEAAIPMFFGAVCILLAALASTSLAYTMATALAAVFLGLRSPLMTALYRENYRSTVRGQIFGIILVVVAGSGVVFTALGGKYLNQGIEHYPLLIGLIALFAFFGALSTLQIPAIRLSRGAIPNPFAYFSALRDLEFLSVIITWSLFGLANLAMMPQRFEYVSQGAYGFSLSPGLIALVNGVIPEVVRVLTVVPMGRLFDRMNFIHLRIFINLFLLGYQVVFFTSTSFLGLCLGAIMLGVGNAGGSVAWSLWVTRYATAENTARYMAVHTFFTGLRGIVAPYFGYWLASLGSIRTAAWVSSGMIAVSCGVLLLLERRSLKGDSRLSDLELAPEPEE